MGYHMVKWGAGVHQWQVTLRQLFNQLFVSSNLRLNELERTDDFSGVILPK